MADALRMVACPDCQGRGSWWGMTCKSCGGGGRITPEAEAASDAPIIPDDALRREVLDAMPFPLRGPLADAVCWELRDRGVALPWELVLDYVLTKGSGTGEWCRTNQTWLRAAQRFARFVDYYRAWVTLPKDVREQEQQRQREQGRAPQQPATPTDYVMPFGKHRGTPVAELPIDYVRWLSTIELRSPLREAVQVVLQADWRALRAVVPRRNAARDMSPMVI